MRRTSWGKALHPAANWRLASEALATMRPAVLLCGIAICGSAHGQTMVETAAAAAGGSVGGVAGKKVSDWVQRHFSGRWTSPQPRPPKEIRRQRVLPAPPERVGTQVLAASPTTPLLGKSARAFPGPDGSNVPPRPAASTPRPCAEQRSAQGPSAAHRASPSAADSHGSCASNDRQRSQASHLRHAAE